MASQYKFFKLICYTIIAVILLFFAAVGIGTTWNEYIIKDYDTHLTEQVYLDVAVNNNTNLVFYKRGCPYCEKGKGDVINTAKKSIYPTFYIDVESEAGQVLVKKYQVKKAATIVQIREGESKRFIYAEKDVEGKYRSKTKIIQEALNDHEKQDQ